MKGIRLHDRKIAPGEPVFVIAEAGVNHNGDLDMGRRLIDAAVEAGADAVKFQTFKTENIITRTAPKAQYHIETTGRDDEQSWFELLKSQELDAVMHEVLIAHCREQGILFLSTPYDEASADLLEDLNVPLFKVASTDANNIRFLEYLAAKGRPMILSTAMCEMAEVEKSVRIIQARGIDDLVVLQCTGSYPAPADEANLTAMNCIGERLGVAVGYSDHVLGSAAALAAVALGAVAYEKHFTLDRTLPGPDHRASLEPAELTALVAAIREVEAALGDGDKRVMPCETQNRAKLRKSVLAVRAIRAGETLDGGNLVVKRAGGAGLAADRYHDVTGRRAGADIVAEQPITEELLG